MAEEGPVPSAKRKDPSASPGTGRGSGRGNGAPRAATTTPPGSGRGATGAGGEAAGTSNSTSNGSISGNRGASGTSGSRGAVGPRDRVDGAGEGKGSGVFGSKLSRSNTAYVQVLGTGMDTGDTSPCLLLFFDHCRFIFNAGEGLQRFCIEHKVRLARIHKVLLTRVCSETAAGLPGMLLTLASTGNEGLAVDVCGPSDLSLLARAMRIFVKSAFIRTTSFGVGAPPRSGGGPSSAGSQASLAAGGAPGGGEAQGEGDAGGAFVVQEDELVRISAVVLTPPPDSSAGGASSREPAREGPGGSSPGGGSCVVYVCEMAQSAGKFNPAAARALGLRPGPKFGLLQQGRSVLLDDGVTMIHPHQVMASSDPPPTLLILDCPSPALLPSLAHSPALRKFTHPSTDPAPAIDGGPGARVEQGQDQGQSPVTCVVHLTPQSVLETEGYLGWMASLGPSTHHVLSGHGRTFHMSPILVGSARITAALRHLAPFLFPSPPADPPPEEEQQHYAPPADLNVDLAALGPLTVASNLLKFNLRSGPKFGVATDAIPAPFCAQTAVAHSLRQAPEAEALFSDLGRTWGAHAAGAPAPEDAQTHRDGPEGAGTGEPGVYPGETAGAGEATAGSAGLVGREGLGSKETVEGVSAALVGGGEGDARGVPGCLQGLSRDYLEVSFLGTGSSQPSKYRNLSGILLNFFRRGAAILDCGEGTFGQLKLLYGQEETNRMVADLKLIWISHIHADHHTGLIRILAARRDLLMSRKRPAPESESLSSVEAAGAERGQAGAGGTEGGGGGWSGGVPPVLVVGPRQLKMYLEAYSRLEDLCYCFLDCRHTLRGAPGGEAWEEEAPLAPMVRPGQHEGEDAEVNEEQAPGREDLPQGSQSFAVTAPVVATGAGAAVGGASAGEGTGAVRLGEEGGDEGSAGEGSGEESETRRRRRRRTVEAVLQSQGRQVEGQPGTGAPAATESAAGVPVPPPGAVHREGAVALSEDGTVSGSGGGGAQKERPRGLRPFEGASLLGAGPGGEEVARGLALLRQALGALGLRSLQSVPVVHCNDAFAVVLQGRAPPHSAGAVGRAGGGAEKGGEWKVVYSGDTRPCQAVVQSSRNATLLIHEATFEDDLVEEARARRHSTTSEAVGVGEAAGAYRTVLTHFSQRYPKMARVVEASEGEPRVCVAFDLMRINFADLPLIPRLLPAFQALFPSDQEDEEEEEGVGEGAPYPQEVM